MRAAPSASASLSALGVAACAAALYLQSAAVFSAGRLVGAKNPDQADRLLKFLASSGAAPALRESGLEP